MSPLTIRSEHSTSRPGDLGARVHDHDLLLPDEVAQLFAIFGVRDAVTLLAYLYAFPSSVASGLHWDIQEVTQAREKLRKLLKGHVDSRFLIEPRSAPNRAYGAIDPQRHPRFHR